MKLTEIDIDRFRIWRNLLLRLDPSGLNVIYGPNEAGKTTLMRFIRSVLYGYEPLSTEPAWHRPDKEQPWRGAVRCEHHGRKWRIHRRAEFKGRGRVRISGAPEGLSADQALEDLLNNTSESLYADIFAVGVRELQQLATLGTDQVSEYIYGLSLGPQGRQILDSIAAVRSRREQLLSPNGRDGELVRLFEQYATLSARKRRPGTARDQYVRLTRRRTELTQSIDSLRERQSQINNELRGLRFLQDCHKPWKRGRELQDELGRLPLVTCDPEEALRQLAASERDIQDTASRRDKLNEKADQLKAQASRIEVDEILERERLAVSSVVEQADWLRQVEDQIQQAEERSAELRRELNHELSALEGNWSLERLQQIDASSSAHHRLLQSARSYQAAIQRQGKLRRWNRSLSKKSQQELIELNADLDLLGISVEEAIRIEQNRMQELENLGRLRLQEEQLALKIQTVRRVMSRVETDEPVPPWVDKTVSAIGWIGTAFFFFGVLMYAIGGDALETLGGALGAAAFGFAGIMWWSVGNGLRNHFDRQVGIQLDDLTDEARQADRQLRTIQDRIGSMSVAGLEVSNRDNGSSSTTELIERIGQCSRRITDLERLARRQERAMARRRRLQVLRDRFRSAQQTVNEERSEWCRVLNQLGLEETVDVQQAFDWWQRLQELRELHTRWRNIAPEAEGLRRMFQGMKDRISVVH
ncbi:MAG: AAA family ATPase, partial [Planctomycetaceae bacterium]|nr:AAA family ATPase [Planctomycetaceae bacterium]